MFGGMQIVFILWSTSVGERLLDAHIDPNMITEEWAQLMSDQDQLS